MPTKTKAKASPTKKKPVRRKKHKWLVDDGLEGHLKTGPNKSHSYIIHPECPLCQAKDQKGEPIRLIIDKYLVTHSPTETKRMLVTYGIDVTVGRIKTHYNKHSPFISEMKALVHKTAENLALSKIENIEDEIIDAEDVIQEVITIGGQKIRSGDMPVDGKLLTAMIREQGSRRKMGTLQEMMAQLDRQRFTAPVIEGEVVDDEKEETTT